LFWIPLLIGLNAFFVAAEMALARVRHTRMDQLAEEGNKAAKLVQMALEDPERYISACQLGITLATLGLGAVGENALAHFLEENAITVGHNFGWFLDSFPTVKTLSYVLAFGSTALIQTIFGELLPKTLTFSRAEAVMLATVYYMEAWCWLAAPFVKLLNSSTTIILHALKVQEPPPRHYVHSEEELKMLVSASHEEGVLEPEEEEMLHSVFDFSDTVTGEIMTPRTDMIAVQADATVKDFIALALKHGFSRIPVYEENIDNIFGLVHIRDCVQALVDHKDNLHVRELVRKVLIVPENKNLGDLLPEFQKSKTHMAIVVDEYGATRGMVTLEDVVEELVGDIADEYDVVTQMIQEQPDGTFIIDARLTLEEANEQLGLKIVDEEFNTLGGHVFGLLGREPAPGDEVKEDGYTLRIEESDKHRIIKLRLMRHLCELPETNHALINGRNGSSTKESNKHSESSTKLKSLHERS
jgi:CBS domain containing-hemolysin-like protein